MRVGIVTTFEPGAEAASRSGGLYCRGAGLGAFARGGVWSGGTVASTVGATVTVGDATPWAGLLLPSDERSSSMSRCDRESSPKSGQRHHPHTAMTTTGTRNAQLTNGTPQPATACVRAATFGFATPSSQPRDGAGGARPQPYAAVGPSPACLAGVDQRQTGQPPPNASHHARAQPSAYAICQASVPAVLTNR